VERIFVAIDRHWHTKHMSVAVNKHTTIEELFEGIFCSWSMPRTNIINVQTGDPGVWEYNWVTLILGI
jgi:hypothetical protein